MDSPNSHPIHDSPSPADPSSGYLPPVKLIKSITPEVTGKQRHQFAVPKDVTEGSASRTITSWRKLHEINLLESVLDYNDKNETFPFDDPAHMQKFYKSWIERGVYIDEDVFTNKLVELPERFFKNQDKTSVFGTNLKAWMPPVDVRIYELSALIWGKDDEFDDDDFDDVVDVDVDMDDADDDGTICDDPKV